MDTPMNEASLRPPGPMPFRLLLDEALRLARRHFRAIYPAVAIPVALLSTAAAVVQATWFSRMMADLGTQRFPFLNPGYLVMILVQVGGLVIANNALQVAVIAVLSGAPVDMRRAWRFSLQGRVVGTLFLVAVGLGPFAGVMALAINTGAVLAKLFSEAVESIDPRPVEGVRATGAHRLQEIAWGVIPQVGPLWTSYALYRFESNARSATVLGLIGAGGIGQLLFDSMNGFQYGQTAAIVIVIVVAVSLIDLMSQALRQRLM